MSGANDHSSLVEVSLHWRRLLPLCLAAAVLAAVIGFGMWSRLQSGRETQTDSRSPDEQFRETWTAVERGDVSTVSSTIRNLRDEPGYGDYVRLLEAVVLVKSGRPQAALPDLVALHPSAALRTPAEIVTAEALYKLNRFVEARLVINRVLAREPQNVTARRWLASIYWDLGANAAAAAELREVTRLDPGDYRPWHLLGVIEFDADQFAGAIDHLRKALKRNPRGEQRKEIVRRLARSLAKARRYSELLELVREEGMTDATLLALSGEAEWSLGRPRKARGLLARAVSLEPQNRFALLLTAQLEMQSGDPSKAVPLLEKHLQSDPHDFEARYRLALCCRSAGQPERYREEIRRAEASQALRRQLSELSDRAVREPGNAQVRVQLAEVCRQLGKTKLAELYQRAADAYRR